ncbi:MAG TPA: hypothetical protein VJI68_00040 [Candidatus Nanoarchaeia archaeon]|nr:hypothetical protein [Candidatus Nanoarchaeia archaeon]
MSKLKTALGWGVKGLKGTLGYLSAIYGMTEKDLKILREDKNLRGISPYAIDIYYRNARKNHMGLLVTGAIADISDKVTSAAGTIAEFVLPSMTMGLGVVGGLAADTGEEVLEMIIKLPFYCLCYNADKTKIPYLIASEVGSFIVPTIGDLVFDARNLHVRATREIIRDEAKEKILRQYALKSIPA